MKKFSFILLLLLCYTSFATGETLRFSKTKNLQSLEIVHKTKGFYEGTFAEVISMNVDHSKVGKYNNEKGFHILSLENCKLWGNEGDPTTLMVTKKVCLPRNAEVTGVKLLEGEYTEIENEIYLAPRPKPLSLEEDKIQDIGSKKNDSYDNNAFFPGNSVSLITGEDSENTIVYLQFHPLQYNPVTQRTVLINNAKYEINYNVIKPVKSIKSPFRTDAENLIVTSPAFQDYAEELKVLYVSYEGISSEVITTQWIADNYAQADEPSQAGYANITGSPVSDDYDYALAKKIVSLLRDTAAHPNLQSITLFGDVLIVPPSYYFYIPFHGNNTNNWIVSDLFYSSPDYDLVMNYDIGRIPASNTDEAEWIVDKYDLWKTNLNEDWFNNVQVFGGATFGSRYLMGEMGMLDAINQDYYYGLDVEKNFHTNGKESRAHLLPHFSDNNTGILFCSGHGSGSSFLMTTSSVSSNDIANIIPTSNHPVLLMIACHNGKFDNELVSGNSLDNFGETCLFADAGSISFWGSVRPAFVGYDYMFDEDGELIIFGSTYLAGMLINCIKAYADGYTRLGAINRRAMEEYIAYLDMDNQTDFLTIYETVYLGDPVFSIPPRTPSNQYDLISMDLSPTPPQQGFGFVEPTYFFTVNYTPELTISGITNSPTVNMNIYEMYGPNVVEVINQIDYTPPFEISFNPITNKSYLTCFSTYGSKETRLYFSTASTTNIPPTKPVLHDLEIVNDTGYDVCWAPSIDYEGESVSYRIKEMKSPLITTEECNTLDNWQNNGFSVTTGGHNSLYCYHAGNGADIMTSITTTAPVSIESGDAISFWKKYVIEPDWDYFYVEISEDGEDFTTLETYSGINNSWTHTSIDLSDYAGKSEHIRFRYKSDFVIAGSGFYIDDIAPANWFEEINYIENLQDTLFHVDEIPVNDIYYQVKAVDETFLESDWSNVKGMIGIYSIPGEDQGALPITWSLHQNFPNPFDPKTTISFSIKQNSEIELEIFNIKGQKIKTVINEFMQTGNHSIVWYGDDEYGKYVNSGLYFYKLSANGKTVAVKKCLLVK